MNRCGRCGFRYEPNPRLIIWHVHCPICGSGGLPSLEEPEYIDDPKFLARVAQADIYKTEEVKVEK